MKILQQTVGEAMSYQHKELAAGKWKELSLAEQMANIGKRGRSGHALAAKG